MNLSESQSFAFQVGLQDYRAGIYRPISPVDYYNAGYDSAEAHDDAGLPSWAGDDISNIY